MKKHIILTLLSTSLLTLVGCGSQTESNVTPITVTPDSSVAPSSSATDTSVSQSSKSAGKTYDMGDGVFFVAIADYADGKVSYNKAVSLTGGDYPEITDMADFTSGALKANRTIQTGDSYRYKGEAVYADGKYTCSLSMFSTCVKSSFSYDASTGKFKYTGTDDTEFWNQLIDVEGLKYVIATDGTYSEISSLADQTNVYFSVPIKWVTNYNASVANTFDSKFIGIYAK